MTFSFLALGDSLFALFSAAAMREEAWVSSGAGGSSPISGSGSGSGAEAVDAEGRSEGAGGKNFLECLLAWHAIWTTSHRCFIDEGRRGGGIYGISAVYARSSLASKQQKTIRSNPFPSPSLPPSFPFSAASTNHSLTTPRATSAASRLGYPYTPVLRQLNAILPPFSAASSRLVL